MKTMLSSLIRKIRPGGMNTIISFRKVVAFFAWGLMLAGIFSLKPFSPLLVYASQPTPTPENVAANAFPIVEEWDELFPDWFAVSKENTAVTYPQTVVSQVIKEQDPNLKFALIQEVRELAEVYRLRLVSEAGWIHRVVRSTSMNSGLDMAYELEGWYRLDEQQDLIQALEYVTSENGEISDVRLYREGKWERKGFSQVPLGTNIRSQGFDFGFSTEAARLVQEGASLNRMTLYENCWYMGELYTLSDGVNRLSALYYPDTGKLRSLESWRLDSDGIKSLWQILLPVEERLDHLPGTVLAHFKD
jgi:hypothetical protein